LVSAREHVIVTYPGRSLRDGSPCAPSVVVDELLEEIARMTGARLGAGEAGDGPSALVTSHPLHAFSPRYFDASDASLFSFSASDRMGAEALVAARARRQDRTSGKPWVEEALPQTPSEAPVLREVGVAELVRFFEHPVRAFMQRRLGLYLREDAPELEDREPLELDALGQWKLADLELRHRLGGVESERAGALLRASGSLPPGALGKLAEKAARDRAGALLARVEQARRGDLLEPVLVDRSLSGWQIRGEIGDLWSGGRVVHQLSKIPHRRELGFWIRHLVLNWLDAPGIPRESSLVAVEVQGRSRDPIVVHLAPHPDPEPVLRDLLALYELGLTVPLPLLGTVSRRHADRCANGGWHDAPLEAARREWENSFVGVSESDDAYLLQAFRDVDPFAAGLPGGETFESVTRRVYEPYLERRGSLDAGTSE
jgi:exodeoxyribonuclease V gamma subunit